MISFRRSTAVQYSRRRGFMYEALCVEHQQIRTVIDMPVSCHMYITQTRKLWYLHVEVVFPLRPLHVFADVFFVLPLSSRRLKYR